MREAWDSEGFHHLPTYVGIPWCRCGLNFSTDLELQEHFMSVSACAHWVQRGGCSHA